MALSGVLITISGLLNLFPCPAADAGRPCLLCGCTRDVLEMCCGRFQDLRNPNSPWFLTLIAAEIVWRAFGSWKILSRRVAIGDIAIHAGLVVFFGYFNVLNLLG